MGQIPGEKSAYFWVNPRTGEKSTKNNINNTGIQTFTPPTKGYGLDWVMVLESLPDPKPEVKPEPAAAEVKSSSETKAIPEANPSSVLKPTVGPTTPGAVLEVKVEPKPQATATTPSQASSATTTPSNTPAGTVETRPSSTSTLQANPVSSSTSPTVNTPSGNSSATSVNASQPVNNSEVKAPN